MARSRNQWLVGLALAGSPFAIAAEPDCYYGEGGYTFGTILCQVGEKMQCARDEEGRPVWNSLNEQCIDASGSTPVLKPAASRQQEEARPGPIADAADVRTAQPTSEKQEARRETAMATDTQEVISPEARVSGGNPVIEILWADYGRDGQTCNAAPSLADRCGGAGQCEIVVGPDVLCGDPFPGHVKLLSVYWSCRNGSNSRVQPALYSQDDQRLALNCER